MNIYDLLLLMMAPICSFSAVRVCHQAPDAHCFVLIKLCFGLQAHEKLSRTLFKKPNNYKPLPAQSG